MSYEPVDIYITDNSPLLNPLEGVVVRAYSQNGKLFYTQATTDVLGHAGFLLPSNVTYQLRFYKPHVTFTNPLYISVLVVAVAGVPNAFNVLGEIVEPPTSRDARLCIAFGYFRRIDGAPAANVDIHLLPKFKPLLLDGDAILTEGVFTRTDDAGYIEVPLIRCGQYDATVQGLEDYQRCISIPDQANVNFPDLLFPIVDRVTFTPPLPGFLLIGQEVQVVPTVIGTDGNILEPMVDVIWSTSDNNILGLLLAGGVITLRGVGVGVGYVQAVRADQSIVHIPDLPIKGVPAPVVVVAS